MGLIWLAAVTMGKGSMGRKTRAYQSVRTCDECLDRKKRLVPVYVKGEGYEVITRQLCHECCVRMGIDVRQIYGRHARLQGVFQKLMVMLGIAVTVVDNVLDVVDDEDV